QTPSNGYSLCSAFQSSNTGAATTTFNFSEENAPFTSITASQPIVLGNSSLNLKYGGNYMVSLTANYTLTNGVGTNELIQVVNESACSLQIMEQPLVETKPNQQCSN